MRVALAAVLFAQPDLLLLDEPTNYLDLEGSIWLEAYLAKYPHTVIIISHDRGLLNRAVEGILHLEEKNLTFYSGPYDQFARQRAERRAVQAAMAKKQQARKDHMQSFVDRFKAKASKAKQAQSRLKMIEKMDMIAAPEEAAKRVFTFPEPEELSPPIINIEGGSTGYGETTVLSRLDLRIDQDDRIALLGKNGQGKSTLSKLLSDRLPLMSGRMGRSTKLRIGYFAQHQVDELIVNETPLQHLQTMRPGVLGSKLRAKLAGFGLGPDQAETEVGRLSGGQKARLSLLLATLDAPHMLILDEPTNDLDVETLDLLQDLLGQYDGTVLLVSHDRDFLDRVAVTTIAMEGDGKATVYAGGWSDYVAQRGMDDFSESVVKSKGSAPKTKEKAAPKSGLSFTEKHRLDAIPAEMERLEAEINKLQELMSDPELFTANPVKFQKATDALIERQSKLDAAEEEWVMLEDKAAQE